MSNIHKIDMTRNKMIFWGV